MICCYVGHRRLSEVNLMRTMFRQLALLSSWEYWLSLFWRILLLFSCNIIDEPWNRTSEYLNRALITRHVQITALLIVAVYLFYLSWVQIFSWTIYSLCSSVKLLCFKSIPDHLQTSCLVWALECGFLLLKFHKDSPLRFLENIFYIRLYLEHYYSGIWVLRFPQYYMYVNCTTNFTTKICSQKVHFRKRGLNP
jgi:hypothetical protein